VGRQWPKARFGHGEKEKEGWAGSEAGLNKRKKDIFKRTNPFQFLEL
jgi:hypothetical protein